jgi:hypothetical protein
MRRRPMHGIASLTSGKFAIQTFQHLKYSHKENGLIIFLWYGKI